MNRFHALLICSIPFTRSLADSTAQSSYNFHEPNLRCGAICKEGTPLRSVSVCREHQVSQTARPPCKEHPWQRPAMKDSPLGIFQSAGTKGGRKANARRPPVVGFAENPWLRVRFLSRPRRHTCDPTSAMCENPEEIATVLVTNHENPLRFKRT